MFNVDLPIVKIKTRNISTTSFQAKKRLFYENLGKTTETVLPEQIAAKQFVLMKS